MIDDESETKTEWIGEKEQVRWSEREWGQRERQRKNTKTKHQVNSVTAIRSIWWWSEITACDDKYWSDKTAEAEIWAVMNTKSGGEQLQLLSLTHT